jgi:hypothetical protein
LIATFYDDGNPDTRENAAYVAGMRRALELYLGADEARCVLFARGVEY